MYVSERHLKLQNDHPDCLLYFQILYRVPAGTLHVHHAGHNSVHTVKLADRLIAADFGEEVEGEVEKRSPGEP